MDPTPRTRPPRARARDRGPSGSGPRGASPGTGARCARPRARSPAHPGQVGGIVLQDRVHRLDRAVAPERSHAREHLEEHRPEGEDVRAVVHRLAPDLLGRHEAHRPQHHARFRGRGGVSLVSFLDDRRRTRQLGEAEVEDLDPAVVRDEDVVGLEVAVDDPLVVSGGEAVRDLERVVEGLADGKRSAAPGGPCRRLTFEQLRDDVGSAARACRRRGRRGRSGGSGRRRREPPARSGGDACDRRPPPGRTLIATSRSRRGSRAR